MKVPVIFANWKMNKTLSETKEYFQQFLGETDRYRGNIEIFVLVPHTVLALAADLVRGSPVKVGSQNHFWEDFGPFTGEISAAMVRDCGGEYAMIGHFERRHFFGETLDDMHRKTRAALRNRLIPLICIGESLQERKSGGTVPILSKQTDAIFKDLSPEEMARCQILYEPYWAIGAEEPARPAQAQEAHAVIREGLKKGFKEDVAGRVKILYGGSVRWDNVNQFLTQKDVDGVGVGRASWNVDSFLRILDAASPSSV